MRSLVLLPYFFSDTPYFFSTMQRPKPRSMLYLFITMASSMSYLHGQQGLLGLGLRDREQDQQ